MHITDICNDYVGIYITLAEYWLVMRFHVTASVMAQFTVL